MAHKCRVRGCKNYSNQGTFVGYFCAPCHRFLSGEAKNPMHVSSAAELSRRPLPKSVRPKILQIVDDFSGGMKIHELLDNFAKSVCPGLQWYEMIILRGRLMATLPLIKKIGILHYFHPTCKSSPKCFVYRNHS